jgi:phosphatidylserine decarboxylase
MKKSSFYSLTTDELVPLKIQRDAVADWLFTSTIGKLVNFTISFPVFSHIVSKYLKSSLSLKKIESFKSEFEIEDTDFKEENFKSLNDYFIRQFKPSARPFSKSETDFSALAEGYYLVSTDASLPIKGVITTPRELIQATPEFEIKQSIVVRLSPKEYHRFHFPFSGVLKSANPINGKLYSINPVTLNHDSQLFIKNKRIALELEFDNQSRAYVVLIGATYIGSIQITHDVGTRFSKGDQCGYFEFGGSTAVILLNTEMTFKEKILNYSRQGIETFAKLGETIAIKAPN